MTTTPPEPGQGLTNLGISIIRTVVPFAWGWALTWVASQIPLLEPALNAPAVIGLAGALEVILGGLWYTLMRTLEKHLPAWLTVVVLGANTPPVYVRPTEPTPGALRIPRQVE